MKITTSRVHRRVVLPIDLAGKITLSSVKSVLYPIYPKAMSWSGETEKDAIDLHRALSRLGGPVRSERLKRTVTAWLELNFDDAAEMIEARKGKDPDVNKIENWLAGLPVRPSYVTPQTLCDRVFNIPDPTHRDKLRIARVLRGLGWSQGRIGAERMTVWIIPRASAAKTKPTMEDSIRSISAVPSVLTYPAKNADEIDVQKMYEFMKKSYPMRVRFEMPNQEDVWTVRQMIRDVMGSSEVSGNVVLGWLNEEPKVEGAANADTV